MCHHHRERIELIKDNNKQKKYIEQKPYFDNKKKFNHFHQKPKCIDIRLDLTQNKSNNNRPYLSVPSPYPLYA